MSLERYLNGGRTKAGYSGEDSMRSRAEKDMAHELRGAMEPPRSSTSPDRERMRMYAKGGHVNHGLNHGQTDMHFPRRMQGRHQNQPLMEKVEHKDMGGTIGKIKSRQWNAPNQTSPADSAIGNLRKSQRTMQPGVAAKRGGRIKRDIGGSIGNFFNKGRDAIQNISNGAKNMATHYADEGESRMRDGANRAIDSSYGAARGKIGLKKGGRTHKAMGGGMQMLPDAGPRYPVGNITAPQPRNMWNKGGRVKKAMGGSMPWSGSMPPRNGTWQNKDTGPLSERMAAPFLPERNTAWMNRPFPKQPNGQEFAMAAKGGRIRTKNGRAKFDFGGDVGNFFGRVGNAIRPAAQNFASTSGQALGQEFAGNKGAGIGRSLGSGASNLIGGNVRGALGDAGNAFQQASQFKRGGKAKASGGSMQRYDMGGMARYAMGGAAKIRKKEMSPSGKPMKPRHNHKEDYEC